MQNAGEVLRREEYEEVCARKIGPGWPKLPKGGHEFRGMRFRWYTDLRPATVRLLLLNAVERLMVWGRVKTEKRYEHPIFASDIFADRTGCRAR
jgi:hypothetical protein